MEKINPVNSLKNMVRTFPLTGEQRKGVVKALQIAKDLEAARKKRKNLENYVHPQSGTLSGL